MLGTGYGVAMRIEACEATLGATVTDVSLAALSNREWQAIEQAFLDHAVLIFPGQHLSSDDQVDFAKRFGPIEHLAAGRDPPPPGAARTSTAAPTPHRGRRRRRDRRGR